MGPIDGHSSEVTLVTFCMFESQYKPISAIQEVFTVRAVGAWKAMLLVKSARGH